MTSSKSPDLAAILAQLRSLDARVSELHQRLPISVEGLHSLVKLQKTLADSCRKLADPTSEVADDIAEALSSDPDFALRLADELAKALAVKLAPLQPFLVMLMQRFAAGDEGS